MEYREVVGAMHRLELIRRIRSRRVLSGVGLHPGQPQIIGCILNQPGCTQKEVADALDISPASVASSLKRLDKAGVIYRVADKSDARRNCLFITDAGKKMMETSRAGFEALDRQMMEGFGDDDIARFHGMLVKMFDNLADDQSRDLNICKLAREALAKERK